MAVEVQVFGVCDIKVGTGSSGALERLGYNRDNTTISKDGYFLDVPGDQNGGDSGPPIDVQYFGEIARVRLEMSKWDATVASKVSARTLGGTDGTYATVGDLMFQGSKAVRLLLHSATAPLNFPRAFVRSAIEVGRGSKFATFACEFECHKDANGVLYNATTT